MLLDKVGLGTGLTGDRFGGMRELAGDRVGWGEGWMGTGLAGVRVGWGQGCWGTGCGTTGFSARQGWLGTVLALDRVGWGQGLLRDKFGLGQDWLGDMVGWVPGLAVGLGWLGDRVDWGQVWRDARVGWGQGWLG